MRPFLATALTSFAVYFFTLPPSVTLDMAGHFIVAADYLGVPTTPGYPLWTILAWFFQWVFHSVQFHGHPNPAWPVALMSAVFGSLTCGTVAALSLRIARSEIASISAGLLLAFSPTMWSQSVLVHVHTLHAFFAALILYRLYIFDQQPDKPRHLWMIFLLLGLGAANSMAIVEMLPVVFLVTVTRRPWPRGHTAGIAFLCLWIGPLLYNYLPIASEQNPPMNWAYARTSEGFLHSLTRGQYERISLAGNLTDIFASPAEMGGVFLRLLLDPATMTSIPFQFTAVISCVGLLPLLFARSRWIILLFISTLMLAALIWWTAHPKLDLQTLFIFRTMCLPVYIVFTPLLAAGLALLLARLHKKFQ